MISPRSHPPNHAPDIPVGDEVIAPGQALPSDLETCKRNSGAWLAKRLNLVESAHAQTPFSWREWLASKLQPGEGSRLVRFLLFYGGVFAPVVLLIGSLFLTFAMVSNVRRLQNPPWLLAGELLCAGRVVFFLPLLVYAMTACTLVLWNCDRYGRRMWVRWGLYSGVILAMHFWFLHGLLVTRAENYVSLDVFVHMPMYALGNIGIQLVLLVIGWVCFRLTLKFWRLSDTGIVATSTLAIGFLGFLIAGIAGRAWLLGYSLVLCLVILAPLLPAVALIVALPLAAPAWAVGTYLLLSIFIGRRYGGGQLRLWQFFLAFVWFGLYFSACRFALGQVLGSP